MMTPRRKKKDGENKITLEERLGPDVLKRLEAMAGEFVRFERGQFGFYIDPARYAVKQRQVGPLGRGRRRKVVAGVDKDGNVITAWIGVDTKNRGQKTGTGETINIPEGYAEGAIAGGARKGRKGRGTDDGEGGASNGAGGRDGDGKVQGSQGRAQSDGSSGPNAEPSAIQVARAAAERRASIVIKSSPTTNSAHPSTGPQAPKPPSAPIAAKDNTARGRQKKPLHWAKVPNNLLKNTVWETLSDENVQLDEQEIDDLFGVDATAAFDLGTAEEAKPEVLTHKRKHNTNILLANLKMTSNNIKDLVRALKYKDMSDAQMKAAVEIAPTPEEEQLLLQNLNIKDQVDKTDAFMMELCEIKGLKAKLQCAWSAQTFNSDATEVIKSMDAFAMIPNEVSNSAQLRTILETVLALGNFLNSGTGRGGAHGFKLEALAMLSTVKDAKGSTLMDYLITTLLRNRPGTVPITDMPTLPQSSTLSLDSITEEVTRLTEDVQRVAEQVIAIGDDPELAAFKTDMEAFATEGTAVKQEIVSLRGLMMNKLQEMMAYFGERNKASRGRQEDILRMLRELVQEVDKRLALRKERDERLAKQAKKNARNLGTPFADSPSSSSSPPLEIESAPTTPTKETTTETETSEAPESTPTIE